MREHPTVPVSGDLQTTAYQAWGTIRARLENRDGHKTAGRDGFYLHDSGKGESHGCVETYGREIFDDYLIPYMNGHKEIDFVVGYTTWETGPKP
jgi:hypothetical protein